MRACDIHSTYILIHSLTHSRVCGNNICPNTHAFSIYTINERKTTRNKKKMKKKTKYFMKQVLWWAKNIWRIQREREKERKRNVQLYFSRLNTQTLTHYVDAFVNSENFVINIAIHVSIFEERKKKRK